MNLAEALDIVVGRTGHERFRQLCDPNDPAYAPGYIPLVMSLATGEPVPCPEPVVDVEFPRAKPRLSINQLIAVRRNAAKPGRH